MMPFVNALRLSPTSRLPNCKLGYSQHSLLDLRRDPVGARPLRTGQAVDQPFGAVGLEVAADFVELLAGIPRHFAGAAHVGKLRSQLQPPAARACGVLSCPWRSFRLGSMLSQQRHQNPLESGSATGTGRSGSSIRARLFGGLLSGDYDLRTDLPPLKTTNCST
jgi:hypothetical protein